MQADNTTKTPALPTVLAVCVNWNGRQVLFQVGRGLAPAVSMRRPIYVKQLGAFYRFCIRIRLQ